MQLENGLKVGDLAWYSPYGELRYGYIVKIKRIYNTLFENVEAKPFPIEDDDKIVIDFGSRFMPLPEAKSELQTMSTEVTQKYNDLLAAMIALESS